MRTHVLIRVAKSPSEQRAVAELVREYRVWDLQVTAEHGYDPSLVAQAIYPTEEHDDGQPTTVLLASVSRAPAGCGMLRRLGSAGEIKRLYVRPTYRGLGIGGQILSTLTSHARATGIKCLQLETAIFMTDALALYQRAGFRVVSRDLRNEIGLRDVAIFMEKYLPDQA